MNLKHLIETVPDWPRPGVNFLDITPVLADPVAFAACTDWLAGMARDLGATSIVGIESRGFLFAAAAARLSGVPLIIVRKPNKLPGAVYSISYDTEYSADTLAIKTNAAPGDRPLIVDDVLATGGTLIATAELLRRNFGPLHATAATIINLAFLPGAAALRKHAIDYACLETYA